MIDFFSCLLSIINEPLKTKHYAIVALFDKGKSARHRGDALAPLRWRESSTAVTDSRHRGGVSIDSKAL